MSEATYAAMREFIKIAVELEVKERVREARDAILAETRAVEPGAPGKDGRDGRDGVDGKDGRDGKDGEPGAPGEKGERGADGLQGRDGKDGERGEKGERGADGIASRAELDAIVEARFGELQVRTFADLYQGVFDEKRSYTRGSLATWGGSLWLSLAETRARPGEGNNDWKLVVKRGADGKR